MSQQNIKKNPLRQTSIFKTKPGFKIHKIQTDKNIQSFKKLPSIMERKYSSSKNLIVSNTCQITTFPDEVKQNYLTKIKNKISKLNLEKQSQGESEPSELKYCFQKRKQAIQPIELNELKKYSSCNKLNSFPSIPQILIPNDQSFTQNQNIEPQRQIKSSNSIKLQTIQYVKKPRFQRIPLKKILKSQMSKTINPRNIDSQHSIQLQNEQKIVVAKKKSKIGRDTLQRIDSKTKILVKNPFNKLPKKHSQMGQKLQITQNLQNLQNEFKLSKIFEDLNNQSDISMSGKSDIQNLIGYMNI